MGDVNFSDRSPKRTDDGHTWKRHAAQVTFEGKQLFTMLIWKCERCPAWTVMDPRFTRSEDMKECTGGTDG